MAETLDQNPFAVLGASTGDDVRRLARLADEAALFGDGHAEEAFSALTHSMRRLDAEIRWLPGASVETARKIAAYPKKKEPAPYPDLSGMTALAQFNACRALLETWVVDDEMSAMALVCSLSAAWDEVRAQAVMDKLNEDRRRASVPLIADIGDVYDRLDGLCAQVVGELLARAKAANVEARAVALGAAEQYAKTRGHLTEALVNAYAVEAAQEAGGLEKEIRAKCTRILEGRNAPVSAHLGEKIGAELSRWASVTEPMRRLIAAKGREDERVYDFYRELYRAASHLNNACLQRQLCVRLFRQYDAVFFDLPSIKEHLHKNLALAESVAR